MGVKTITKYLSDDGDEYSTIEGAEARNGWCRFKKILGGCNPSLVEDRKMKFQGFLDPVKYNFPAFREAFRVFEEGEEG